MGRVLVGWTLVFVVAITQRLVRDLSGGGRLHWDAVVDSAVLILPWALATPFIFRSAGRWPIRSWDARRHLLVHTALGIGFVVLFNVTIRLPLLFEGAGSSFGSSLALGLVRYAPLALVVYGVLVAFGHAVSHLGRAGPTSGVGDQGEDSTTNGRRGALTLQNGRATMVLDPAEVDWIEARDNYVRIHSRRGPSLVRERISALEKRLDADRFVRIHRSAIVAVTAVREIRPRSHGDAVVVLRTGQELRLTRTRRSALETALNGR